MRVLFWYCDRFAWTPTLKTLEGVEVQGPGDNRGAVVAFVHVEPRDVEDGSSCETKLVKNSKWLARKWEVQEILLHSFTHLGEAKADPAQAHGVLDRVKARLVTAGYQADLTAFGYYNDLVIEAPGHPLARIYKEF